MGMSRGSKWKRAAVIPYGTLIGDEMAERIINHLRAHNVSTFEWWRRNIRFVGERQIERDDWLMVPRNDYPIAILLAREIQRQYENGRPDEAGWHRNAPLGRRR